MEPEAPEKIMLEISPTRNEFYLGEAIQVPYSIVNSTHASVRLEDPTELGAQQLSHRLTGPGHTALTVIWCGARSSAAAWVSPISANFDAA